MENNMLKTFFYNIINDKPNTFSGYYDGIEVKQINGINYIGDLIVDKYKIISPLKPNNQKLLDCLKLKLINNNYNPSNKIYIHNYPTNKDFIIKDNKIYFNNNLINIITDKNIIHFRFNEMFFLTCENIINLINKNTIVFNDYDKPDFAKIILF